MFWEISTFFWGLIIGIVLTLSFGYLLVIYIFDKPQGPETLTKLETKVKNKAFDDLPNDNTAFSTDVVRIIKEATIMMHLHRTFEFTIAQKNPWNFRVQICKLFDHTNIEIDPIIFKKKRSIGFTILR